MVLVSPLLQVGLVVLVVLLVFDPLFLKVVEQLGFVFLLFLRQEMISKFFVEVFECGEGADIEVNRPVGVGQVDLGHCL